MARRSAMARPSRAASAPPTRQTSPWARVGSAGDNPLKILPPGQILTVSSSNFAKAELRDGADESASHAECTQLMAPRWWSSSSSSAR